MDILNDKDLLNKTVIALKNAVKSDAANKKKNGLKQLFSDDDNLETGAKVNLIISLIKLPPIPKNGRAQPLTIRSPIPHSFVNKYTNILLITRNIKGNKKDFEPTLHAFRDLLRDHNALGLVSEIMPRHQLCSEYRDFESRRNLAQRFDVILCDKSIITVISKELGKPFYAVKKRPIPVNLEATNLRETISKCLSRSILHMNLEGSSSTVQIGRMDQTPEELTENILSTVDSLKKNLPGGWMNVRSVNLKSEHSKCLSLYISLTTPQEIPAVTHPFALDNDEVVAVDRVNTVKSEKVLVQVKRSGCVDVVSTSGYKRRRKERLEEESKEKYTKYDPATNSIVHNGDVVQNKKVERKVPLKRLWKKGKKGKGNKRFLTKKKGNKVNGSKRKLLTTKLGKAKKFVRKVSKKK